MLDSHSDRLGTEPSAPAGQQGAKSRTSQFFQSIVQRQGAGPVSIRTDADGRPAKFERDCLTLFCSAHEKSLEPTYLVMPLKHMQNGQAQPTCSSELQLSIDPACPRVCRPAKQCHHDFFIVDLCVTCHSVAIWIPPASAVLVSRWKMSFN